MNNNYLSKTLAFFNRNNRYTLVNRRIFAKK